ncbi:hypothetical protein WDU99_06530 [Microbacterium sp. Mu-80]|uniref:Uncharacterized protein n=1 Tax=Microbacterium bandirmense TaxID=3122050 RepID=A0ABU8LBL7_9MICO
MNTTIYVDSMIDQRRTAVLNRELEYRRIALERGTMKASRPSLVTRLRAALTHRTPRPAGARHAQRQMRQA